MEDFFKFCGLLRICELYLFDEYLPVLWTLFVNFIAEYSSQIKFTNPADSRLYLWTIFIRGIFAVFLSNTFFWTLFVNFIGEYSSQIKFKNPADSWLYLWNVFIWALIVNWHGKLILRRPQNMKKNLPFKIWRYWVASNFVEDFFKFCGLLWISKL